MPVLFRRGREAFVQDGHTEKLRIDGPVDAAAKAGCCTTIARASSAGCRASRAIRSRRPRNSPSRPWSELSWPDRLRCTRVLGPIAVAVHCLFVKGLIFDGTAGLFYTAQRVTADMILSMHLLRRDLASLGK